MVKNENKSDKETLSAQIWDRIKDIDLELFALPDQTIAKNAAVVLDMSPTDLHLVLNVAAALPQLEEKLARFKWSNTETLEISFKAKFVVISVVSK